LAAQDQRTFSILLLALFASMLGLGIIVPLLPLYAENLGASGVWIGLIFSGFSVSRFIFMPFVGSLSDQMGRKAFIATGLFLYGLFSLGFLVATSPVTLSLLRFGQGFGAAMIIPIAQAYAGDISPLAKEGKYMGLFSVALFSGFGLGPLMGGVLRDLYGIEAGIYALSALAFSAFVIVCLFLPEIQLHRQNPSVPSKGFKALLSMLASKIARGLIVFRFTTAMCRGAIITFVPIFAHNKLQLSSSQIGVVISSHILITSALMMPFGTLADKVNRKALIIIGGLLFSGLIFVLPSIRTFLELLLLSLLSGAFGALVLPAATAVMVEEGRVHGMGAAMSLFNMSMSLGLVCGPLVAGWLTDTLGLNSAFYIFGTLGVLGLAFFTLNSQTSRD